jgi:hypothetical protein
VTLRRILALAEAALLLSLPAAAQGTFAQVAVDSTWSTTFILVNTGTSVAAVGTLHLFNDDGTPMVMQVVGGAKSDSHPVTVPAGGSATLVLDGTGAGSVQGWAKLELTSGALSGQALFHKNAGGGQADAVVPLDAGYQPPLCIFTWIQAPPNTMLLPFDNTANAFATGLALVNVSTATKTFELEYADENHTVLYTDHVTLGANQHTAFMLTDPAHSNATSAGAKGVLRVKASQNDVSVLGLLFRGNYQFSTIIPIATNY